MELQSSASCQTMVITNTFADIKAVVMDPQAKPHINEPYYLIRGEGGENVSVIAPGKNGHEFNKTHGFINNFIEVEVYQCLFGQGVLIMQRQDVEGQLKEFKVRPLRPGHVVEVPSGYASCLVNTGRNLLVVIDNARAADKFHDTQLLKTNQGLAYYVVEKKGEISFDQNPHYRFHPPIGME